MSKDEQKDTEEVTSHEEKPDSNKTCFFITPIGKDSSIEFKKMTALLGNVINPVLKEFEYESVVAHKIQQIGSIGDQVFKSILDASIIITNLTGLNPNVMYETAVAHSFGKPTIMIVERDGETELPFDVISDRAIFFDDSIGGTGALKDELREKIAHIENNPDVDNPVLRVLERTATLEQLSGRNDLESQVFRMFNEIQTSFKSMTNQVSINNQWPSETAKHEVYMSKITVDFENGRASQEELSDIAFLLEKKFTFVTETSVSNDRISIVTTTTKKMPLALIKGRIEQAILSIGDFGQLEFNREWLRRKLQLF